MRNFVTGLIEVVQPPDVRTLVARRRGAGLRRPDVAFSAPIKTPAQDDPDPENPSRYRLSIMANPRTDFMQSQPAWGRVNVSPLPDGTTRFFLRVRDKDWPLFDSEKRDLIYQLLRSVRPREGDTVVVIGDDGFDSLKEAPTYRATAAALKALGLGTGDPASEEGDEPRIKFKVTAREAVVPLGVREGIVVHTPNALLERRRESSTIQRVGSETVVLAGRDYPPDRVVARFVDPDLGAPRNEEGNEADDSSRDFIAELRTEITDLQAELANPTVPAAVVLVDRWHRKKTFTVTRLDQFDREGNEVLGIRSELLAAVLQLGAGAGDTIRFEFPKRAGSLPVAWGEARPVDRRLVEQYEAIARHAAGQINREVASVRYERNHDAREALVITLGKRIHPWL